MVERNGRAWRRLRGEMQRLREAQSLSVADVADLLGVPAGVVHGWEFGLAEPSVADWSRWAAVLGLRLSVRVDVEADVAVEGRCCRYCGRTDRLTVEHLTPVGRGGSKADPVNRGWSCEACNRAKGPLTDLEFLVVRRYQEVRAELVRWVHLGMEARPLRSRASRRMR